DVSPLLQKIFRTFVIYAFVEELVKFLHVRRVITKDCGQISWMDCIAYFGIVGIGFQIIETVTQAFTSSMGQLLVKGITMGHPSYGMMMGYFIGRSYRTGNRSDAWTGFLLPFFLHGLYDLSLSEEFLAINDNLIFVPFILIAIEVAVLIRLILFVRKHRDDPEYTEPV
ncbi:MAG: PrsW family intramembrane metalloprotease, partial [Erysipelotrichaceae bacterium]|nr:PrsW family intramembrane metalloprotease [Erysipelotrichaceae bacterium]